MDVLLTKGGTTFTIESGNVTITRHDQPECTVPEADLEELCRAYFDDLLGPIGDPENIDDEEGK